jgi:hypothetical protein
MVLDLGGGTHSRRLNPLGRPNGDGIVREGE